jgi:hypothetical protein
MIDIIYYGVALISGLTNVKRELQRIDSGPVHHKQTAKRYLTVEVFPQHTLNGEVR